MKATAGNRGYVDPGRRSGALGLSPKVAQASQNRGLPAQSLLWRELQCAVLDSALLTIYIFSGPVATLSTFWPRESRGFCLHDTGRGAAVEIGHQQHAEADLGINRWPTVTSSIRRCSELTDKGELQESIYNAANDSSGRYRESAIAAAEVHNSRAIRRRRQLPQCLFRLEETLPDLLRWHTAFASLHAVSQTPGQQPILADTPCSGKGVECRMPTFSRCHHWKGSASHGQLAALVAVRRIGKREAILKLAEMTGRKGRGRQR